MELPVRPSMVPNARWQFVLVYTAPDDWRARALDDVAAAVLDGAVRVGDEAGLPLHHFPLEQAAEAHAAVEDGAVGKVLIDVRDADRERRRGGLLELRWCPRRVSNPHCSDFKSPASAVGLRGQASG